MDTNFSKIINSSLVSAIDIINKTEETVNFSDSNDIEVKDLFEEYLLSEKSKFVVYRAIAYILGVLIIVSNLSVVVSSGLILKKGQKPKSTYILLGNVSLADTIVGFSVIVGLSVDAKIKNSTKMCVFQTGMLVCPAMASILSVGLIAIDRYIYILHGLYYQRWFNTTRVRIGIVLIWMISVTLSFLPATGWVNNELASTRCFYVGLFPGELILINSIISIIPIAAVLVLYTFILVKALKTVKTITNTIKIKDETASIDLSEIRINRRTVNISGQNMESLTRLHISKNKRKRSASFNYETGSKPVLKYRSKSIENLSDERTTKINSHELPKDIDKRSKIYYESDFSVCTVESMASSQSLSMDNTNNHPKLFTIPKQRAVKIRRMREPNKWRAIKVVMLTSGSFIFTWIPFFVVVIFFVFCEEKLTNPQCIHLRALIGGPLAILAFVNSMLNPLIYAWWHKGFQSSVKAYYKHYLHKYVCHVVR